MTTRLFTSTFDRTISTANQRIDVGCLLPACMCLLQAEVDKATFEITIYRKRAISATFSRVIRKTFYLKSSMRLSLPDFQGNQKNCHFLCFLCSQYFRNKMFHKEAKLISVRMDLKFNKN